MNKKIVLLMLILCLSVTFMGCQGKGLQVEFPDMPEGYDEEFWKVSYVAYEIMKQSIDNNKEISKEREEYLEKYMKIDPEELKPKDKTNLSKYKQQLEKNYQLYLDINQLYIDILELKCYDSKKDKDDINKCKNKIMNSLNQLDEFYKSLEK